MMITLKALMGVNQTFYCHPLTDRKLCLKFHPKTLFHMRYAHTHKTPDKVIWNLELCHKRTRSFGTITKEREDGRWKECLVLVRRK